VSQLDSKSSLNLKKSMSDRLWKFIAYGYFISNTLCLIVLLEILILGKPYISLFLLILAATAYLNLKNFKILN